MRPHALLLLVLVLPLARGAVSVTVSDSSSALGTYAPSSGMDGARGTTSDPVAFSNFGATERQALAFTASFSLAYRGNSSVATTTVPFQGRVVELIDLAHAAQSSSGSFLPLRVRTAADLTGEAGWTKAATCGVVTYQGSFSVVPYASSGSPQSPIARFYQVCDASRIYVGASKDMTLGADDAWMVTVARTVTSAAAEHELALGGAGYVFFSAASASTVTLHQGLHQAAPVPTASTVSLYPMHVFPDGFPAGTDTITLTATAYDITT